jgi:uncharacterized ion transporter superfamily protein YfcC
LKYYNKDYANFIISDETERRIETEKPKKYSWYQDREYNEAYIKSRQRFTKQGGRIAFLFALLSIFYLFLSISGYYFWEQDTLLLGIHLLIGLCGGLVAIFYYYAVKKARADELKKQGNTAV